MQFIYTMTGLRDAWGSTHGSFVLPQADGVHSPHHAVTDRGVTADSPLNSYSKGKVSCCRARRNSCAYSSFRNSMTTPANGSANDSTMSSSARPAPLTHTTNTSYAAVTRPSRSPIRSQAQISPSPTTLASPRHLTLFLPQPPSSPTDTTSTGLHRPLAGRIIPLSPAPRCCKTRFRRWASRTALQGTTRTRSWCRLWGWWCCLLR
jgi:hypothetical protein